jgi:hypothetical protein
VHRAIWADRAKRGKKKIDEIGAFLTEIGAKFKVASGTNWDVWRPAQRVHEHTRAALRASMIRRCNGMIGSIFIKESLHCLFIYW